MNLDLSKIVVAVDGPAGAGKSTVARIVADQLGLLYIDTGAMYRAVTYLAIQNNLDPLKDQKQIIKMAQEAKIKLEINALGEQKVYLNDQDITNKIRTPEIAKLVSAVSAIKEVRERLVYLQQEMGKSGAVILDGRDIGTTVFPNADLKVFLVASSHERAVRRQKQQKEQQGIVQNLQEVQAEIERRDYLDCNREVSPLTQAADAILLDTDGLTIDQVVNKITDLIKQTTLNTSLS